MNMAGDHPDFGLRIADFGLAPVVTPDPQSSTRNPQSRKGGFTLIELVVSMAITTVLMLGIGSAMLIASRAVPDAASPTGATVSAAQRCEQLTSDLQYAISINSRSATVIEFTVADRSGDGLPEVIRYEWSGTAGAPLTRQYNGGTAIEVLADVRDFALSYDLQTISTLIPQGNESAETILKSYCSTVSLDNYPIKSTEWYGQYFRPALPVDAVSWKVTRIRLLGRTDGSPAGECRVQLQQPTVGKLPSGTVLEEKTLVESSLLAGYQEQEFAFTHAGGLSATQGLCIVVKWIADAVACRLWGVNSNASTADSFLVKSADKGVSWTAPAGMSLLYTVYGTVTTSGPPQIQNTYYLKRVNMRLRTGSDTTTTVQTAVSMLNRPEVTQ